MKHDGNWRISRIKLFSVSVPGELPFVNVSRITSSGLTIHWGSSPCEKQNGDITGYKLTWGTRTQNNIPGADTFEVTVRSLNSSTTYHFKIAAMNRAGTGPFKNLTATTLGMSVMFVKLC